MSHVLITGATGYLGSVLVPLMAGSGKIHKITLAVRDPAKLGVFQSLENSSKNKIGWVRIQALLAGDVDLPSPDVICHLAKERKSSGQRAMAESLELMAAMIQLAHKLDVGGFIFTSSQAVYGLTPPTWTEDSPVAPATAYGMMSYASELMLHNASVLHPKLRSISLRIAKLVGPAPFFRSNQGETPHLIATQALAGQRLKIERGSTQQLDFVDLRDAAATILNLLGMDRESWPTTVNLGGGQPISLLELARLTSAITEKNYGKPLDFMVTDPGSNPRHFGMSIERLTKLPGQPSPTPLEQTIADICALIDARNTRIKQ